MPDTVLSREPIVVAPGDTEPLAFIFEDAIPAGATVSSPSIAVSPSDELAFTGEQANAAEFNDRPNDKGRTVPIGKAVLATPGGQVAGQDYLVTVTVTLSSGGNKEGVWPVHCRDGSE